MDTKRISWIDIARGIGIILVVYGHALNGDSYRHLIYSFHMPLFFFLSGVVHHHKKEESFVKFFNKTFRRIMLLYFIFALVTYAVWFVTLRGYPVTLPMFGQHMLGIINGNSRYLFYNTLLWFLPCLFITKVGFEILTRVSTNKAFLSLAIILFSVIGYTYSIFFPKLTLPLGSETALSAIVFFGLGYLWYHYHESLIPRMKRNIVPLFIISAFLWILIAEYAFQQYGLQIDMRVNRLNNYFLFYLAALLGISMTLSMSMLIGTHRILEYLGKQSLILFIWHYFILSYLSSFLLLFVSKEFLSMYKNYWLAPLNTIAAIGIVLVVTTIFNFVKRQKFLPLKNKKH